MVTPNVSQRATNRPPGVTDVVSWVRSLTGYLEQSNIWSLEAESDGVKVHLVRKTPQNTGEAASGFSEPIGPSLTPPDAIAQYFCSPGIGLFYARHPEDHPATKAALPRTVPASGIVGFLRVGHLYRPVISESAVVLSALCVEEGALVGFGDRLFEITV